MDDTIYRQDAIDALNEYFVRIGKLKRRGLTKGEKAISLDTVGAIKTLSSAQLEQQWISVSERMPEEDHWLGGSGRQFSDEVLVSVANYDDEDIWTYISQTIDGEWALELPSHCKIIAWMPLPKPYQEGEQDDNRRV